MNLEILSLSVLIIALIILAIIDIKTKEVPNYISYSLLIFGLFIAVLKSIQSYNLIYLFYSLKALFIFYFISNILYITKQWGGGDAKLLMGISVLIPIYPEILLKIFNPSLNINFIWIILINMIFIWGLYGIIYAIILSIIHKNKFAPYFKKKIKPYQKQLFFFFILFLISLIISYLYKPELLLITFIIFVSPIYFIIITLLLKSIEEISFIKTIPISKLREGDYVLDHIKIKNKTIYIPNFEGITKSQISQIKNSEIKIIKIKEGMAFVPAISISIIISLIFGNIISLLT